MNKAATIISSSQQALWFLIVGASAALVHFLVLISIVNFTAMSPAWANVFAFLVAFVVSFTGHFYLTFRQKTVPIINNNYPQNTVSTYHSTKRDTLNASMPSTSMLSTLIKWFASSAAGFMANQGLFVLGLDWFGERYYMLIWLVVTGVITVMTFVLGKLWAFKS
ncbi:GtrA family protein [Psychrobacter urativorans]|uniref:GtrA/DPMS transmembrane domain-containing protein n=1 Tax=Psychrobacter urativorans TaxID=45610 RepID=A0A0M5MJ88_9GAMM|nr:GtrA family protein [Psychrobacter urativorans]ALF58738.1 hypothetical protein AOC03_00640 [Psychrobacter urativorans]